MLAWTCKGKNCQGEGRPRTIQQILGCFTLKPVTPKKSPSASAVLQDSCVVMHLHCAAAGISKQPSGDSQDKSRRNPSSMCQVLCENEKNKDRHRDSQKGASQLKMYSYLQALRSSLYTCPSKKASLFPFYLHICFLVSALRFISTFSSNCVPFNTSSLLTTQSPFRFSMFLCLMVSSFVVSSLATNYQSAATVGKRQLEAIKTL